MPAKIYPLPEKFSVSVKHRFNTLSCSLIGICKKQRNNQLPTGFQFNQEGQKEYKELEKITAVC
jgi:hypothetical protein